jgi:hemolysin III
MNSQTPDGSRGPGQEPGQSVVDDAAVRLAELLMIKPRWRGWIHTFTAPLALAAGIILVVLAPTEDR